MDVSPREVREDLMASSEEFQQLARKHSEYEAQLEELSKTPYLSVEDLTRQTALKKMKLALKDRMEQMVALHRRQAVGQ